MTLSEIDTILEDLAKRHVNLDKELLTTLLLAAGWESKLIRDAVVLFEQNQKKQSTQKETLPEINANGIVAPSIAAEKAKNESLKVESIEAQSKTSSAPSASVLPQNASSDITFYKSDGGEEGKLPVFVDIPIQETERTLPSSRGDQMKKDLEREVIPVEEVKASSTVEISKKNDVIKKQEEVLEVPNTDQGITFYDHDGKEEKELHDFGVIPVIEKPAVIAPLLAQEESKLAMVPEIQIDQNLPLPILPKTITSKEAFSREVPSPHEEEITNNYHKEPVYSLVDIPPKKEPESLIVHEQIKKERPVSQVVADIPDNLPLLPFESSSHVWAFSKYKDTFHGEVMPHTVEELSKKQPIQEAVSHDDEGISLEKTPMTRGDESLVFLAGVMLLVIILILGYMYSNGRL